MWHAYRSVMIWANHLDRQEWLILLLVIMVAGFLCMRGFGSRSNY